MNFTKQKALVLITVVLLLSNIALVSYFLIWKDNGKGMRNEKHKSPMTEFLQKEIGFTPQQMALFDSLKQQHHASIKPFGEALGHSRDSLYLLVSKDPDDSALQSAAQAVGRRQAALELKLLENFRQIRALCTPEQLPRFDSLAPALVRKMASPRRQPFPRKSDSSTVGH